MIKLFYILGISILSCGPTKTSHTMDKPDAAKDSIPSCLRIKINSFKTMQKHEQPQRVVEYKYKGKKVYYVVMPCCDFFNEVYDSTCKLLGSPDGGFSGRGDGKLPDFFKEATNEKIIWQAAK